MIHQLTDNVRLDRASTGFGDLQSDRTLVVGACDVQPRCLCLPLSDCLGESRGLITAERVQSR